MSCWVFRVWGELVQLLIWVDIFVLVSNTWNTITPQASGLDASVQTEQAFVPYQFRESSAFRVPRFSENTNKWMNL